MDAMTDNTETAILAGGCFWGVQELLRQREGIVSTRVGYTGGENENPTYRHHPGHAEAVEIVFDPERISYRDILEFFFQIHDPTTKDRQGNDIGSSYRSEVFYTSDEQRQIADRVDRHLAGAGEQAVEGELKGRERTRAVMGVHRGPVAPLAGAHEAVRVGERGGERVAQATRLRGGFALGLGQERDELV